MRIEKVEPTLTREETIILPPCISTSDLEIGKPKPVPPCVRVSDKST